MENLKASVQEGKVILDYIKNGRNKTLLIDIESIESKFLIKDLDMNLGKDTSGRIPENTTSQSRFIQSIKELGSMKPLEFYEGEEVALQIKGEGVFKRIERQRITKIEIKNNPEGEETIYVWATVYKVFEAPAKYFGVKYMYKVK